MDEPLEQARAQSTSMRFWTDDNGRKLFVVANDRYVGGLHAGVTSKPQQQPI